MKVLGYVNESSENTKTKYIYARCAQISGKTEDLRPVMVCGCLRVVSPPLWLP